MTALTLESAIAEAPHMTPLRARQFVKFGIATLGDLLAHYPKRYEDRRTFDHFPRAESEAPVPATS